MGIFDFLNSGRTPSISDEERAALEHELEKSIRRLVTLPATLLKFNKDLTMESASVYTKAGGAPYQEEHDKWPFCPTCKKPLAFIFQVNFGLTPHPEINEGLYAIYFCLNCLSDQNGEWCVKRYAIPNTTVEKPVYSPDGYTLPACSAQAETVITAPEWMSGAPDVSDIEAICEKLNPKHPYIAYEKIARKCGIALPFSSLLGGHFCWVQYPERFDCKICGNEMRPLLQLYSEDEPQWNMWGDCGTLYFFQCKEHLDEFGFTLQWD